MRNGVKWILVLLAVPALLTGCWNAREPQDITYVTAMGFDFKDGRYTIYAQILGFSNIAKQENGGLPKKSLIYIAKGTGDSLAAAYNKIYETAQQQIVWGHTSSIVLTESVLKEKLGEVTDFMNRYPEYRYNIWVYGTKSPMEKLFSTSPLFNLSPLQSILHEPKDSFKQHSVLQALYWYRFIQQYKEPGRTTLLPVLSTSSKTWIENTDRTSKNHEMLFIDGAFPIRSGKLLGHVPLQELERGYQWMNRHTVRYLVSLNGESGSRAFVVIKKPRISIHPMVQGKKAYFDVHIQVTAELNEMIGEMPYEELTRRVKSIMESQIRSVYKRGIDMQADLLGLETALYRRKHKQWTQLGGSERFPMEPDSLRNIRIDLNIRSTGKYQFRK